MTEELLTITPIPGDPIARLRAAADVIEGHPSKYDQGYWMALLDDEGKPQSEYPPTYSLDAIRGMTCTAQACIAGWGVLFTPEDEFTAGERLSWNLLGARAFGFAGDLAAAMFDGGNVFPDVPGLLRQIAEFHPGDRPMTLADVLSTPIDLDGIAEGWIDLDDDEDEDDFGDDDAYDEND